MQYEIPGELWRGLSLSLRYQRCFIPHFRSFKNATMFLLNDLLAMNWYFPLIWLVILINSSCSCYIHYPEIFTLKHNLYCFTGEDSWLFTISVIRVFVFLVSQPTSRWDLKSWVCPFVRPPGRTYVRDTFSRKQFITFFRNFTYT